MSGLDNFLMLIQQGMPDVYSAFGDPAYNAQYLQCIRSYYISLIPGVDIADDQKICNNQIKPCRQAIEWSYGNIENFSKYARIQETTALARGCRMQWSNFVSATYCRIFTCALMATRHPVTKNLTSCLQAWRIIYKCRRTSVDDNNDKINMVLRDFLMSNLNR